MKYMHSVWGFKKEIEFGGFTLAGKIYGSKKKVASLRFVFKE